MLRCMHAHNATPISQVAQNRSSTIITLMYYSSHMASDQQDGPKGYSGHYSVNLKLEDSVIDIEFSYTAQLCDTIV